jgi:hypothetical protein
MKKAAYNEEGEHFGLELHLDLTNALENRR